MGGILVKNMHHKDMAFAEQNRRKHTLQYIRLQRKERPALIIYNHPHLHRVVPNFWKTKNKNGKKKKKERKK